MRAYVRACVCVCVCVYVCVCLRGWGAYVLNIATLTVSEREICVCMCERICLQQPDYILR